MAIGEAAIAANMTGEENPERPMVLKNHAQRMLALDATQADDANRAIYLHNLSLWMGNLYERTSSIKDLDSAITNANLAAAAFREDHFERASCLANLSDLLSSRCKRTGSLQDLQAAITNASLAVAAPPDNHPDRAYRLSNLSSISKPLRQDHPNRAACLSNLSTCLFSRCHYNAYLTVAATPDDHLDRARSLNNIAICLSHCYKQTGSRQDLEAVIINASQAVAAHPDNHPDYVYYVTFLSDYLSIRCERTGNPQDLETALQYLTVAANMPNALPLQHIQAAQWSKASVLAENAVQFLPLVCTRYLSRDDQQYAITQTAGLAADACSIFLQLGRPEKAFQTLEFGRGLILGYLIDSRSDVDQLRNEYQDIAEQYDRLRLILSQSPNSVKEIQPIPLPDMIQTPIFALNDHLWRFRSVGQRGPGPSSRDIGELALLYSFQGSYTPHYDTESLHWLWSLCVKLVVNEIRPQTLAPGTLPRIWWIGTGVASSLPFHAGGDHSHPTENTINHSISSAMPTTPNKQPLPGVEPEIKAIRQASGHVLKVQLQKYPTRRTVLDAMKDTDIIHFACHGSSDPVNPSRSHLLLQRCKSSTLAVEKLTVQQISDHVFGRARIAYLSARSTAQRVSKVAGFGHLIASLWSVDDATFARMASYFYGYLVEHQAEALSNRLVAEALHTAVLGIRGTEHPSNWASFTHYGA
ncbi:CHAT domain-containing protein [Aspergillus foveolatus]|uniref:CHAT domain-containing protein n=1 Tax=Aspergillus foveolatus TaxID=210207 RepID=UPI003CCD684D